MLAYMVYWPVFLPELMGCVTMPGLCFIFHSGIKEKISNLIKFNQFLDF